MLFCVSPNENKTIRLSRQGQLEPVEFGDLNLLVGVYGVGKTQFLKAIMNLTKIANGAISEFLNQDDGQEFFYMIIAEKSTDKWTKNPQPNRK